MSLNVIIQVTIEAERLMLSSNHLAAMIFLFHTAVDNINKATSICRLAQKLTETSFLSKKRGVQGTPNFTEATRSAILMKSSVGCEPSKDMIKSIKVCFIYLWD